MPRRIQEEREAGHDTDDRLLALVRSVAAEEFDASAGVGTS